MKAISKKADSKSRRRKHHTAAFFWAVSFNHDDGTATIQLQIDDRTVTLTFTKEETDLIRQQIACEPEHTKL